MLFCQQKYENESTLTEITGFGLDVFIHPKTVQTYAIRLCWLAKNTAMSVELFTARSSIKISSFGVIFKSLARISLVSNICRSKTLTENHIGKVG